MSKRSVAPHFLAPLHSLVSFQCEGRKAAVGGIDDQGRAFGFHGPVAAVPPELVVGGSPGNSPAAPGPPWGDTARLLRVAILPAVFAPFPGRRFLIGGEKLL